MNRNIVPTDTDQVSTHGGSSGSESIEVVTIEEVMLWRRPRLFVLTSTRSNKKKDGYNKAREEPLQAHLP